MSVTADGVDQRLERHRKELTRYCERMLGSRFDADDAVQETLLRAWRSIDRFQGRATMRVWLYRIAMNVCLDLLDARSRRPIPVDPASDGAEPEAPLDCGPADEADPAQVTLQREEVRLAFAAAIQRLPARQRGALILCEVLHWTACEAAELLGTSVASVTSALQRARATLARCELDAIDEVAVMAGGPRRELLQRYVDAFATYDLAVLTSLIREDAGAIREDAGARRLCDHEVARHLQSSRNGAGRAIRGPDEAAATTQLAPPWPRADLSVRESGRITPVPAPVRERVPT